MDGNHYLNRTISTKTHTKESLSKNTSKTLRNFYSEMNNTPKNRNKISYLDNIMIDD